MMLQEIFIQAINTVIQIQPSQDTFSLVIIIVPVVKYDYIFYVKTAI